LKEQQYAVRVIKTVSARSSSQSTQHECTCSWGLHAYSIHIYEAGHSLIDKLFVFGQIVMSPYSVQPYRLHTPLDIIFVNYSGVCKRPRGLNWLMYTDRGRWRGRQ